MIEIKLASGRNAQFANGEVASRWYEEEKKKEKENVSGENKSTQRKPRR